jgi:methionyl-tRNA formyltransferase
MKILVFSGVDCSSYLEGIIKSNHNVKVLLPHGKIEPMLPDYAAYNIAGIGCEVGFVNYNSEDLIKEISKFDADVVITIGWRRILKSDVIHSCKKIINIHPALLPYYKGYHTEPYVIRNAETEHGITAHYLTEGLDDGDIILQRKFRISEFSTIKTLKSLVSERTSVFFYDLIKLVEENSYKAIKQNHELTKVVAKKRTPSDSEIDPTKSVQLLFDEIRSCDPDSYPAYFYHKNKKVGIKIFTVDEDKEFEFDL